MGQANTARTTRSSLKDIRSSIEPPPRQRITVSNRVCQFAYSRKGSEQFGDRILALDCRREHSQLHRRTAPGNDMDHILERRPPCRSDDSDPLRIGRDRLLVLAVEQALGFQTALELFIGHLQRTDAWRAGCRWR